MKTCEIVLFIHTSRWVVPISSISNMLTFFQLMPGIEEKTILSLVSLIESRSQLNVNASHLSHFPAGNFVYDVIKFETNVDSVI